MGFGVLGFRAWGLGFGVEGLGFRVWAKGLGVRGLVVWEFKISNFGFSAGFGESRKSSLIYDATRV